LGLIFWVSLSSESELVRKAILDVFRGGQAHIARVTDATKIATLIRGLLGQHGDRASTMWALKLVETMPSLVKDNESIRTRSVEEQVGLRGHCSRLTLLLCGRSVYFAP
jgi:hypothetical protein